MKQPGAPHAVDVGLKRLQKVSQHLLCKEKWLDEDEAPVTQHRRSEMKAMKETKDLVKR